MAVPLDDVRTFRSLAKSHVKEIPLLKEIIWRWRRYSAFVAGVDGYWAAHPLSQWREWNGNTARRTFDRWLKTLEDFGLIERERHRYSGTGICSFIRPTELALKHLGDDADLGRLKVKTPTRKKSKCGAAYGAKVGASNGATLGATDHTSFPTSSPSKSKTSHANAHTKGKEGFGEEVKTKLVLKKKPKPEAPIPPPLPQTLNEEVAAAKMQAKQTKAEKLLPALLKKFPILEGPHRKGPKKVWHPYEMHGWKWATWTIAKIVERYAVYQEYVANWYIGKQGEPHKPFSYDDTELKLDADYPDIEEWLKLPPKKQMGSSCRSLVAACLSHCRGGCSQT